jgi:hypothetical protein
MKKPVTFWLLACLLAALAGCSCPASSGKGPEPPLTPYLLGKKEAERDVAEGRLRIGICSTMPMSCSQEWQHLLWDKYPITLRFGGCRVSEGIAGYTADYNAVALPEIYRRFGTDILQETRAEAAEIHRKCQAAAEGAHPEPR